MAYTFRTRENRVSGLWLGRFRRFAHGGVCLLVFFVVQACHQTGPSAPVQTLTLIDQAGSSRAYLRRMNDALSRFTSQTGIQVEFVPAPETAIEQLATFRKLLEGGSRVPDVLGIDVIWPGILADNLLDLRPYIPEPEIAAHFPELIANNTVNGRLVALPSNLGEGMLFYRVDLLREYGYNDPPQTWQELERMAKRIQDGERAKGSKNFWGFLWQGAPSEVLTCNALEWQASEGGGTILDENGNVTVDNPRTIRAWERAAHWVGTISPPRVVDYKEWDGVNLWRAGKAAFIRDWTSRYIEARAPDSPVRDLFDIAPLPRGSAASAATLGGAGYGVSRHSLHPSEAAMLVRFLSGRDEQTRRSRETTEPPTIPQLYEEPEVLASNPHFLPTLQVFRQGIAWRPSRAAGRMYLEVSQAYFEAVTAVLTRKKTAAQAAAELQDELKRMLPAPGCRKSGTQSEALQQR